MADIPFAIAGNPIRCPQFAVEPGALAYSYQNGSQVFIGAPQVTCAWPFLPDDDAAAIWAAYAALVTGAGAETITDTSLTVTVPDYANGGLREVKAYMTRPTGRAVGDGTQNMQVTFYNLHATSMLAAYNTPETNYWDLINNQQTLEVGLAEYENNDWQF